MKFECPVTEKAWSEFKASIVPVNPEMTLQDAMEHFAERQTTKLQVAVEKLENLHGHGLAKQQFPHKDDLNFRESLYEAGEFLEKIKAK